MAQNPQVNTSEGILAGMPTEFLVDMIEAQREHIQRLEEELRDLRAMQAGRSL